MQRAPERFGGLGALSKAINVFVLRVQIVCHCARTLSNSNSESIMQRLRASVLPMRVVWALFSFLAPESEIER